MKKSLIVFLTAAALSPSAVSAQRVVDDPPARDASAGPQWKEKLGLNAEQNRKFLAADKDREADLKVLQNQLNAARIKLQAQLNEGADENDIQESLVQLTRLRKAVRDRSVQFEAEIGAFLKPSQRGKLLVWISLAAGKPGRGLDPDGEEELE